MRPYTADGCEIDAGHTETGDLEARHHEAVRLAFQQEIALLTRSRDNAVARAKAAEDVLGALLAFLRADGTTSDDLDLLRRSLVEG